MIRPCVTSVPGALAVADGRLNVWHAEPRSDVRSSL